MKRIILFSVVYFLSFCGFSQDLIVTNDGDSINCKITKIKAENIYFTFKYKTEIRNTLLPLKKVKVYQENFYKNSEVPTDEALGLKDFPQFRLGVNFGLSQQTAKIPSGLDPTINEYFKELKSGSHYGADVTYYFSEVVGVGFKFSNFKTDNALNNIYVEDFSGSRRYGVLKDDINIVFIGPTFAGRVLHNEQKNSLYSSLSLGYMGYTNNATVIDQFTMTGNSVGFAYDLGYDLGISENLALVFQISFYSGLLTSFEIDDDSSVERFDLEAGQYISMHRLDFSVGLRFQK